MAIAIRERVRATRNWNEWRTDPYRPVHPRIQSDLLMQAILGSRGLHEEYLGNDEPRDVMKSLLEKSPSARKYLNLIAKHIDLFTKADIRGQFFDVAPLGAKRPPARLVAPRFNQEHHRHGLRHWEVLAGR